MFNRYIRHRGQLRALVVMLLSAILLNTALPVSAKSVAADDPRILLLRAIKDDDGKAVLSLLVQGVSPNIRESTLGPAIVMALSEFSMNAFEQLLKSPKTNLEARDKSGFSALMMAAQRGDQKSVDKLIARGAKLDTGGWTPLHLAAGNGHTAVVERLIGADANLNSTSSNGTTPMMLAARMGQLSSYQALILAGADPRPVNQANYSAADYLERRGDTERAALLRTYIRTFGEKDVK